MSDASVERPSRPVATPNAISPFQEAVAYEMLWMLVDGSRRDLVALFAGNRLPTKVLADRVQLLDPDKVAELQTSVMKHLLKRAGFSVAVHGDYEYPAALRDAKHPPEIVYFRGDLTLANSPAVSVVGARSCSDGGKARAAKVARQLVEVGYTIVSGLAAGIDTAAMASAEQAGGNLIGVIGTPIDKAYPRENTAFQELVATKHLLMSQVPFYRHSVAHWKAMTQEFPARNELLSALALATVIVEASERSGTLTQARECLRQGRKLFIMNNCFENPDITWPAYYEERGAIRIKSVEDVLLNLPPHEPNLDVEEPGDGVEEN